MLRTVLAQLLIGLVLVTSNPLPAPSTEKPALFPPSPASSTSTSAQAAPVALPSQPAKPRSSRLDRSLEPSGQLGSTSIATTNAEIHAVPNQIVTASPVSGKAAENEPRGWPLQRTATPPVPGIQRAEKKNLASLSMQEVQPPSAPQAIVEHAPDEYVGAVARSEERALPVAPRLSVRPALLRFALTPGGVLPATQSLEISTDRRAGAHFEVTSTADWLRIGAGAGQTKLRATSVPVTVEGRKVGGPLSGQIEVRNLDDPSDVRRIAVEVERAEPGRPLRSRDAGGRLQRVVRPDGGVLDYDYDARGNLVRVRRPDGSAVTWSYDDLGRRVAMTDERGTTVYRYDAQGRLDSVYTPGFQPVRYGYDPQSRLTTLHLPGGKVVAYEYDGTDRLLSVRSDLGTTRYSYDAATRKLAERSLPNGVTTRYGYDGAGHLTGVTHFGTAGELLLSFRWDLDEHGRPVRVTREGAGGTEMTDVAYDAEGRIASVSASGGRVVTYEYDAGGRRTRALESRGPKVLVTDYAYDDLGRLARAGDEAFVYNAAGDLVRRVAPGRTLEYRWDFEGRLTGFTDGRHEVSYTLDGDGRRVGMTVDGRQASLLQDASGWIGGVLAEADAKGSLVRTHVHGFEPIAVEGKGGEGSFYLYDHPLRSAAALVSLSGALAEVFESDPFGAPRTPPDAALPPYRFAGGAYEPVSGLIHRGGAEYDPQLGAFLSSGAVDGSAKGTSEPSADWSTPAAAGAFSEALVKAFGPDRPQPASPRDEATAGRTSGQDPPAATSLRVDSFLSNALPPVSARTKAQRREFPSPYRLDPEEGSVYRRGALPVTRVLAATPRLKLHPEYLPFAKTASGLLPDSQTLEIASSDGQPLSFTVQESIPWLSVSAGGGTAPATLTVTVDPAGLTEAGSPYVGDLVLTNSSDPTDVRKVRARLLVRATGASVTLRSFDANGNLRRVVKPDGAIVDYEVDPLGRVTRVRYPGQPAVSYAYDGNGNRISMTDQRGTAVYQYDRQNRLIGVFTPLDDSYIPVLYGYDKAGRLIRLATPDGRTVLYQYDADGRMTRVTDGANVTTYTYNAVTGLLTGQTLPNGVTTAYTYDADGRLTDVVHNAPGGALLMGFHYTLSALGQRTSVTKQTPAGSELTSYTYNQRGFLKSATYPGGKSVVYTYDDLGNRLTMATTQGATTTTVNYEYDKDNRLLKAGNEVFQYDANGNLIRRSSPAGTTTYTWDARNLLTRVETAGKVVAFEYDGDGNRIAKDLNGVRTNFVNDSGGLLTQVLVEASTSWQVQRSYTYGISGVGQTTPTGSRYRLSDGKDVAALTDQAASLRETYSYDSFGLPAGNTEDNAILFDGEYFDSETSLIYLRARYYDPLLGRFLGRDPVPGSIEDPATHNPYVFVSNDPVNKVDPTGLVAWDRVGKGLLEFGGSVLMTIGGVAMMIGGVGTEAATAGASTPVSVPMVVGGAGLMNLGLLGIGTSGAELALAFSDNAGRLPASGSPVGLLTFAGARSMGQDWDSSMHAADVAAFGASALGMGMGAGQMLFKGPTLLNSLSTAFDSGSVGWDIFDYFNAPTAPMPFLYDGLAPNLQSNFGLYAGAFGLGGVSLNKTADLLLNLQDVTGATFDEATGQIVLLGKENVSLPPLDMNHVAVATQSVFGGQDPGVSIDPPIVNNQMSVRYEGQTRNTRFGDIMFEADRTLKILTLGKDNVTGQTVTSAVPGYKNMLQRRLENACAGTPTSTRMWFQPKEVRLVPSTDGRSMVFDAVSMELLYESKVGNQVVSDPQAAAFAAHFTQNYAAFANERPILKKLEQLGKIVAIVKWIKDNHIPIDLSFLDGFPIEFFSTATSTPTITVQGSRQIGPVTCTQTLQGGVSYIVPNQYLPASPGAGAALNEALANRPSEASFKWTYQPSASAAASLKTTTGPVTAVAESLTRSRRDGNVRFAETDLAEPLAGGGALALFRAYDSFLDKVGPLGTGWSVLPAELRFPLKKERYTFGAANLALDLYSRIWVTERAAGREDAYDLLGIDTSNLPVYRRADAMHVLRQQGDGTFRLTHEDGSAATFRADGKPLSLLDRNGNAVSFAYDTTVPDRLLQLAAADGRTIALSYDVQGRISQASGPGGRQVTYAYNPQGRLATVTDFAARAHTYNYDTLGRLTEVKDAEGRSIFAAGYDDYDRTPARRLGAVAQYSLGFDLETGESTALDPLGRTSRRTQERRQLAAPSGIRNEVYRPKESTDALGNRATVTWADDAFGPRAATDAQGATTEMAWDNRGHLTTVRDPLGKQSERFYDWLDRLTAVRDAEGLATGFGYDNKNNPTTIFHDVDLVLDAGGNLTGFYYDPANVSTFAYDASGNLAATTNPLVQQTQIVSNGKGQPTQVTSPAGVVEARTYDTRARLASTATGGRQVTYGYDTADQVTSRATAAGVTSYLRDAQGRVTRITDALTRQMSFVYDADGKITRVQDKSGRFTDYTYDALGQLLIANLPNGTANAWEYDELGRPVATLTGLGPVAPALALSAESIDFGTVPVGTSRQSSLDLYNQGTAPLTVSGVTVSAPFSVAFSGPVTIPPSGSLRITITFTPSDQAPAAANLTITSDDPETVLTLVALSGEGARKVVNLQATPAQDGIQLTWTAFNPGSQPFGRFNVYRSLTPIPGDVTGLTAFDTSVTSAAATGFLDRLAVPGTSYYYAVTPVYANGDENKSVDPAGPVAYFSTFGPVAADTGFATLAQSENRPAMAYNSTTNEYLIAYERLTAANNIDIFGQRLSASGAPVGTVITLANSTRNERRPRLAYNSNSNNFLVIWEYDQSANGTNYDLQVRTVSATGATGTLNTYGAAAVQDLAPEIAFCTASREYLVAYETNGNGDAKTDIGLLRLGATGALLDSTYLTLQSNSVFVHSTNPLLAYNGTLNDFMLVFELDAANNGSNIEVWGTRLKPDGTLLDSVVYIFAFNGARDTNPFLAYGSIQNDYLLSWQTDAAGDGANLDVAFRRISGTGAQGSNPINLSSATVSESNPRAAYNRNLDDFVMAWDSGGASPKILARRIHSTAALISWQAPVDVSAGSASRLRPDIGTSTASNTFLATWEEDAGAGNFNLRSRLLGTFTPTLQVSPSSLSFSAATTHLTLTITNANPSGGPLQWAALPDRPWMAAQPASGSTTSSVGVDIAVSRTGLAPGTYTGAIAVSSNNGSFTVPVTLLVGNTPPDAPNTPQPADGATDQASVSGGMDLALGWQGGDADGDSVTWAVYLSTDSAKVTALDPTVRIGQGLTTPTLSPAGLTFLKQYFWRAVATDSRGLSTNGPVWRFTTAAVAPPALQPVTPDPTRQTRPALGWQAVTGAATYHLQVANNPGFSPRIVDTAGLTATSFTPAAALPEGTIYWKVRSVDAAGQAGAFSTPDAFVVDITPPALPVVVPVTPDPTNNPRPTLAWSAAAGASSYRVLLSKTSGFSNPFLDVNLSTLTYQPASDLPQGMVYWRVASLDAAGNQSGYDGDQFLLDMTPPPALTGLTARRQGGGVDLAWAPLAGPPSDFARFRIYRSTAPFTNVSGIPLLNESLTSAAAVSFRDVSAGSGVAYWYAVTAVDTAGNENREVTAAPILANEPPAAPVLVAPAAGAQVLPSGTMAVTLAWSASDPENDPLRFEVYLSTDRAQVESTPDITVRIAENLTTPTFDAAGLTYQKTYYWRVAALDLAVDGTPLSASFGPLWSFATPAIPAPVLTPQAPDPTTVLRPTFNWQTVPGAVGYRIEIAVSSSFATTVVATEVTVTSFTPATNLPEGTLYWRVRAIDAQGLPGAFSTVDDFVLDATAPAVPVLVAVTPDPTNNRRPSLAWGAVSGATSYRVQVATEATFAAPVTDTTVSGSPFVPATDLPQARIYWRVASRDAAGNQSAFSAADDFLVSTTAPAVPVLVAVTPDPTNNRRSSMAWGAVAGATSYRVQIATEATFAAPLTDTTVSASPFVPATNLPEARIYWRVASKDDAGNQSAFSAADDFLIDVTPVAVPVPIPYTPDPTSTRRPTVRWNAVAGAGTYRVKFATDTTFEFPLMVATTPLTSYQTAFDLPEGRIYWVVSSIDTSSNQSAYSAPDDFVVDTTAPAVPLLVAVTPDPTPSRRPNLAWGAIADATAYRIQVSTEATFSSLLLDTTVAASPYSPSADLPEGRIYWRVASQDAAGNQSAFSAADDFLVDATPPPVPFLVPVTPDPTSNRRPLLGWSALSGVTFYRVQVATTPAFAPTLVDTIVSLNTFTTPSDYPEATIYWRVASRDDLGNESAFSAVDDFRVDITPPPGLTGLTAGRETAGVRLAWQALPSSVTDVSRYRVYRAGAPFSSVAGRTPVAEVADPLATGYFDASAAPSSPYHYAVTAVDLAGNELQAVTSVPAPPLTGSFYTLTPCRVLDTRNPAGPYGGPALVAQQPRVFSLAGVCGIPATARALVVNYTVVSATAAGSVKAYAGGLPSPVASVINFSAGQIRANNGILMLPANGNGVALLEAALPAGSTVHVLVDVFGYFE